MDLEFDPNKEKINIQKHDGIDFDEANSVLDDPYALHEPDFGHHNEERYFTIGMSNKARLLIVNWTIRNNNFRLISSRLCQPHQRKRYERQNFH